MLATSLTVCLTVVVLTLASTNTCSDMTPTQVERKPRQKMDVL